MTSDRFPHALWVDTELTPQELTERLTRWEPWAHRIEFSNGVSTADLKRRVPFSDIPLGKLRLCEDTVPFDTLRTALDIGCNSGYNSLDLAANRGMHVIGVDFNRRHIEVANFLAGLTGATELTSFQLGDAETFTVAEPVDVVLHFGTLYHLPNPLGALRTARRNLVGGGWLCLETQLYDHPDHPNICYWLNMTNNDPSNYWAISTGVLRQMLALAGFEAVEELQRDEPTGFGPYMWRAIFIARVA